MRNTVWNLRFISYSKERKRQEKAQFGSSYLAVEILFCIFPSCAAASSAPSAYFQNCWDGEIQTTQMCIISTTHKDCVSAIPSYPPFPHQSKILWVPDTEKTVVQVQLEFCTEGGQCCTDGSGGCCPPRRCATLPCTQSPADVPAQSTKTPPLEKT